MFLTQVVVKIRTCTLCFIFFSPQETYLFYEITWKNILEADRPQMSTIRCMHLACWIIKASDTHSEYVIYYTYTTYLVSVNFHLFPLPKLRKIHWPAVYISHRWLFKSLNSNNVEVNVALSFGAENDDIRCASTVTLKK
jgi:hypothetical protein